MSTPTGRRPYRGLSLPEMLVCVLLLAGLAALASVPLRQSVARAAVAHQTSLLLGSLNLARTEALRLGQVYTLCPSRDGETCTPGDWNSGWLVYANPSLDPQPPQTQAILSRTRATPLTRVHTEANRPLRLHISYGEDGRTRQLSGALQMGTLRICSHDQGEALIINASGRARRESLHCQTGGDGDT
jgi:type IV fimbrial biogenesis protein FimT